MRSLRPSLHSHPLKFIHSGRLLTDGILLLPYVRTLEGRHRQARSGLGLSEVAGAFLDQAVDADGTAGGPGSSGSDRGSRETGMGMEEEEKVWLHCVVGAKVEVVDEDDQEGPDGQDGAWVDIDGDADAEGGEPSVSHLSLAASRSVMLIKVDNTDAGSYRLRNPVDEASTLY
jgi:hypothetical protein